MEKISDRIKEIAWKSEHHCSRVKNMKSEILLFDKLWHLMMKWTMRRRNVHSLTRIRVGPTSIHMISTWLPKAKLYSALRFSWEHARLNCDKTICRHTYVNLLVKWQLFSESVCGCCRRFWWDFRVELMGSLRMFLEILESFE